MLNGEYLRFRLYFRQSTFVKQPGFTFVFGTLIIHFNTFWKILQAIASHLFAQSTMSIDIPSLRIDHVAGWFGQTAETPLTPERHMFVFMPSGMTRGGIQYPRGVWFYRHKDVTESVLLLVPPGAIFEGDFVGEHTEVYVVYFDCDDLHFDSVRYRFTLDVPGGKPQALLCARSLTAYEVTRIRPDIYNMGRRFRASTQPGDALSIAAKFNFAAILTWLFDIPDLALYDQKLSPVQQLKAMIDDNPGWGVSLSEMMSKIPFSERHLRAAFKRRMGVSPGTYREWQRRHLINNYLCKSDLPIKTIAVRMGITNTAFLSTYVKRVTGKTPSAIRKEARGGGGGFLICDCGHGNQPPRPRIIQGRVRRCMWC